MAEAWSKRLARGKPTNGGKWRACPDHDDEGGIARGGFDWHGSSR